MSTNKTASIALLGLFLERSCGFAYLKTVKPSLAVLVGIRCNQKLEDGRSVAQLHKRGQQLRLFGLKSSVHVSWYYFKREDGKWEKRYKSQVHGSSFVAMSNEQ